MHTFTQTGQYPTFQLRSSWVQFMRFLSFVRLVESITSELLTCSKMACKTMVLGELGCEPKPVRFFRIRSWKSHDSALSESAQVFIAYILHSRAGLVFPSSGCEPKPVRFFQSVGPSGIPRNDPSASTPKTTFFSPHPLSTHPPCH